MGNVSRDDAPAAEVGRSIARDTPRRHLGGCGGFVQKSIARLECFDSCSRRQRHFIVAEVKVVNEHY